MMMHVTVGDAGAMRIRKMLTTDKELATAYQKQLRILGENESDYELKLIRKAVYWKKDMSQLKYARSQL